MLFPYNFMSLSLIVTIGNNLFSLSDTFHRKSAFLLKNFQTIIEVDMMC